MDGPFSRWACVASRSAGMAEPHARHGILRRLSFRKRRARSSCGGEPTTAPSPSPEQCPPSPCPPSPSPPSPSPPSPSPTPTTLSTSRTASTSTSTLDISAMATEDPNQKRVVFGDDFVHKEVESSTRSDSDAFSNTTRPDTPDRGVYSALDGKDARLASELNRALLSHLECPVCYLPMVPPIRQCLYGHSVCSACEARLARCPTCRGAFLKASNATLNAIALAVRLPCRHHALGCRQHLHLADKARHEEHCPHREYLCPQRQCPWRGTLEDLLKHSLSDHAEDTARVTLNQNANLSYTYSRTKPFEISELDGGGVNRVAKTLLLVETAATDESVGNKINNKAKSSENMETKDGVDGIRLRPRALFRFHLRFDAKRVVLQAALQLVGPPSNSKLFQYKVSLASRDGSFKLSAWSEATSEDVEEAVSEGKVLRVDATSFRHIIDSEGRFVVMVKVVVCRLPALSQFQHRMDD